MATIKRGEPGYKSGKTVRKKNQKAVVFEKKLKQDDDNKNRLNSTPIKGNSNGILKR